MTDLPTPTAHPLTLSTSGRARFADLIAAEFVKLRSLRSTWIMLLLATVIALGIGAVRSSATVHGWPFFSPTDRVTFNPLSRSFQGLDVAQLMFVAIGVLAMTGEYTSGQIRSTLAAVPHRTAVLAAKATALTAVTLIAGTMITLANFLLDQAILSQVHAGYSISHPGVPGALAATAGYLLGTALIGLGLGTLIRHTAAALAAAFGLLFLAPIFFTSNSQDWVIVIGQALPGNAFEALGMLRTGALWLPSTAEGIIVLIAYPILTLIAARLTLHRRDS
jgi:ABC-2 type transport system permease protein